MGRPLGSRNRPKLVSLQKVTGKDVIDWIHGYCKVPEGAKVGQQLRLLDWQQDFIKSIYDNPHGTRRALLSVGRKNGKSSLAACLLLAHLCGPPGQKRPHSQLYSAAQSRDQAALIFTLAAKMVRLDTNLRDGIVIKETAKELHYPRIGTKYKALSSESTTAYGLSPAFIVHDELGQVKGPRSALYEALETATGAQLDPLSIVISTQAPTDADLLSVLLDDAMAGHDPRTVVKLFTAPTELDPFVEETLKLANPAYGTFLSRDEVTAMARDAKRMPAREAEYRNLILNQRVQVNSPFVSPSVWAANSAEALEFDTGTPVFAGLDLSEVQDLTALVMIGRSGSKWSVRPIFWLPSEGLTAKSVADRVPYDRWARDGFLETTPGSSISYEYVAQYLRTIFARYNMQKIAFDKWNFRHLKPWLIKSGFTEDFITDRFVEFGQGMFSMSPALRELEQMLLDKQLAHGNHPVLTMCVSNTIVTLDDAGNRKPSKRKSTGRIDGLVALAMAVGAKPMAELDINVDALIG